MEWLRFSMTKLLIAVAIVAAGLAFYSWLFPPPKAPFLVIHKFDYHPEKDWDSSKHISLHVLFFTSDGFQRESYFDYQPWGTVNEAREPITHDTFTYYENLLGTERGKFKNPQPVPEIYQARYDQLMEFVRQHVDRDPEEQPFGWRQEIPLPWDFPTFPEFRDAYVKKHGASVLTQPAATPPASENDIREETFKSRK